LLKGKPMVMVFISIDCGTCVKKINDMRVLVRVGEGRNKSKTRTG